MTARERAKVILGVDAPERVRTPVAERGIELHNANGYLADTFLPRLRSAGVSEIEIETMTVANPRRLLTIG